MWDWDEFWITIVACRTQTPSLKIDPCLSLSLIGLFLVPFKWKIVTYQKSASLGETVSFVVNGTLTRKQILLPHFFLLCYFKNRSMQKKYLSVSSQAWLKLLTPLRRLIMQYRLNTLWSRTAKLACPFLPRNVQFSKALAPVWRARERDYLQREKGYVLTAIQVDPFILPWPTAITFEYPQPH